jgi:hypothetical protein
VPENYIDRAPERPTAPIVRTSDTDDREEQPRDFEERLLKTARERFRRAKEFERERRAIFDTCVRNVAGQQWSATELKNRVNRPNPVVNMLKQHCKIVLNDMRTNRPGPKVSPKTGLPDAAATAEVIEGMIRDIEYSSRGDIAYDTADKYQVIGGFSFYGATIDYESPESRRQEIRVRRFPDPKAVYGDCDSMEPDSSDWKWCFVRQKFTKEQWLAKFGNSQKERQAYYAANNFFENDEAGYREYDDWIEPGGEHVWLAEYWVCETVKRMLVTLKDGTDVWEDELTGEQRNQIDTRQDPLEKDWPKITQYLIDGANIYETTPWIGRYIPIVPEYADELMVDGKRCFFPLPIFALDAQQAINYVAALWIEAMSLVPKGKWVGALGQFVSKMKDWQHANTSTVSYLEYDAKATIQGAPFPPPQFVQPSVNAGEFAQALQYWVTALMAAIGQYQPSTGQAEEADQSGKAIDLLQKQGSLATSDFASNSVRSRLHFYKILIDLIPKVYSEEQEVRIIGADEKQKVVTVNAFYDEGGKQKAHFLKDVRCDVIVDVGQNYHDLRQKAFDFAQKVLQADPQLWQRIGWLAIKLADLGPLGDQMSQLLEPPDVQMQQQQGMDPQVAQLTGKLQQATQQIHALSQIIENKKVEEGAKADRELAMKNIDFRIHEIDNDVKLKIALINAKAPISEAVALAQIKRDDDILGYTHDATMQAHAQAHEAAMAAVTHGQALEQGQQQADNQAQSQQSDQAFQASQAEQQPDEGAEQ